MRILVPVDGTPECEAPIPVAEQLANALDAEIYLVRVVEVMDAFSPLRFDPDILQMMEDAARYLGDVVSRFKLPADRTRRIVGRGDDAAKEIITIAEVKGIDLIIMGSRHKTWLQRLARGCVYCDVLDSEACPMLGVPALAQGAAIDIAQWQRDHATVATRSPEAV
jgi:nucleotide-binding universal stress UspA family protein